MHTYSSGQPYACVIRKLPPAVLGAEGERGLQGAQGCVGRGCYWCCPCERGEGRLCDTVCVWVCGGCVCGLSTRVCVGVCVGVFVDCPQVCVFVCLGVWVVHVWVCVWVYLWGVYVCAGVSCLHVYECGWVCAWVVHVCVCACSVGTCLCECTRMCVCTCKVERVEHNNGLHAHISQIRSCAVFADPFCTKQLKPRTRLMKSTIHRSGGLG